MERSEFLFREEFEELSEDEQDDYEAEFQAS